VFLYPRRCHIIALVDDIAMFFDATSRHVRRWKSGRRSQKRNEAEGLVLASAADPRSYNVMVPSLVSDARLHRLNALSRKWYFTSTTIEGKADGTDCTEAPRIVKVSKFLESR
jgi:hypothetical protein